MNFLQLLVHAMVINFIFSCTCMLSCSASGIGEPAQGACQRKTLWKALDSRWIPCHVPNHRTFDYHATSARMPDNTCRREARQFPHSQTVSRTMAANKIELQTAFYAFLWFFCNFRKEIDPSAKTPAEIFGQETSALKLIDFGRAIDMKMFPPGTSFRTAVETDGFVCTEMQSGRPWTYQVE